VHVDVMSEATALPDPALDDTVVLEPEVPGQVVVG
jgi:hypothetical protein